MGSTVRSAFKFIALPGMFAFFHVVLLAFSGSVLIGRGIHRLDHPEFPVTALDRTCQVLVLVLEEPYESLKHITDLSGGWIDLITGCACSLMWGSVAALLFLRIARLRARARLTGARTR